MKNVFNKQDSTEIIERINKLTPETKALWGKMSVSKMLSHCCVTYEYVFETTFPKPGAFKRFILKAFVKNLVVSDKPYKKNSPTGPDFIIKDEKEFMFEKERLINYIIRTQELGEKHFDGLESHSFGPLTSTQWNTMFYKHLDHHLSQFGV